MTEVCIFVNDSKLDALSETGTHQRCKLETKKVRMNVLDKLNYFCVSVDNF